MVLLGSEKCGFGSENVFTVELMKKYCYSYNSSVEIDTKYGSFQHNGNFWTYIPVKIK